MKITDIKITVVDLGRLEMPFWNSIVKTTTKKRARVEIYTDEGITGMAPCGASSTGQTIILDSIRAKLLGEDPLRIGYLWDKMYMGGTRKPVTRGPYIASMSVVDNALWDLVGKSLSQPVWKLIGRMRNRVNAYAAGGYYEQGKGLLKVAPHGNPNVGSCCVAAVENGLITENYPTAFNNPIMQPVDFHKDGFIDSPPLECWCHWTGPFLTAKTQRAKVLKAFAFLRALRAFAVQL